MKPKRNRGFGIGKDGRWTFEDPELALRFSREMREHVPGYESMRDVADLVVGHFGPITGLVEDIGSGTGSGIFPLAAHYPDIEFRAHEPSLEMRTRLAASAAHFSNVTVTGSSAQDWARSRRSSATKPALAPSLVTSILTLQFVPVEDRPAVLAAVHRALHRRGALLLIEKILFPGIASAEAIRDMHETTKRNKAVPPTRISAKRASLANVLVPLTSAANMELLRAAGFRAHVIWANLNFRGWLCLK